MEEAKKVANENFDWNAFENDLGVYDQPKEQIGEAYDKTCLLYTSPSPRD